MGCSKGLIRFDFRIPKRRMPKNTGRGAGIIGWTSSQREWRTIKNCHPGLACQGGNLEKEKYYTEKLTIGLMVVKWLSKRKSSGFCFHFMVCPDIIPSVGVQGHLCRLIFWMYISMARRSNRHLFTTLNPGISPERANLYTDPTPTLRWSARSPWSATAAAF